MKFNINIINNNNIVNINLNKILQYNNSNNNKFFFPLLF